MAEEKSLEALQAELIEQKQLLKDLQAKLEKATKPPEPFVPMPSFHFDPTAGMSMPPSALREMVNAIPESVMRSIVNDAFRPNPVTGGAAPQPQQPVQRGSGWAKPNPLEPPPGQNHIDAIVSAQDKIDLVERATTLAKAAALQQAGKKE